LRRVGILVFWVSVTAFAHVQQAFVVVVKRTLKESLFPGHNSLRKQRQENPAVEEETAQ
jgi:hypothetical protein